MARSYKLSESGLAVRMAQAAKMNADPERGSRISKSLRQLFQEEPDNPLWHHRAALGWENRRMKESA